jgi:hypothetical protein
VELTIGKEGLSVCLPTFSKDLSNEDAVFIFDWKARFRCIQVYENVLDENVIKTFLDSTHYSLLCPIVAHVS